MGTTSTDHDVAVFKREDGSEYIMVWIGEDATGQFAEEYTAEDWQKAIEEHPFVNDKNLPVVIAFEDKDGKPEVFGPADLVEEVTRDFDWDNITWGHSLTLEWPTAD